MYFAMAWECSGISGRFQEASVSCIDPPFFAALAERDSRRFRTQLMGKAPVTTVRFPCRNATTGMDKAPVFAASDPAARCASSSVGNFFKVTSSLLASIIFHLLVLLACGTEPCVGNCFQSLWSNGVVT